LRGQMSGPYLLRGYHATSRMDADAILAHGFVAADKPYHWLGQGVYFYQDALAFAVHWARHERKGPPITDLVVIGADIRYDEGILDLADYHWGALLTDAYRDLDAHPVPAFTKWRRLQQPFVADTRNPLPHYLDCFVIDEVVRSLEKKKIDIYGVRGVFGEGKALFPKSHLFDRQHIQIAVRDMSIIVDCWEEPIDPRP
jgi:hypothetical protein